MPIYIGEFGLIGRDGKLYPYQAIQYNIVEQINKLNLFFQTLDPSIFFETRLSLSQVSTGGIFHSFAELAIGAISINEDQLDIMFDRDQRDNFTPPLRIRKLFEEQFGGVLTIDPQITKLLYHTGSRVATVDALQLKVYQIPDSVFETDRQKFKYQTKENKEIDICFQ